MAIREKGAERKRQIISAALDLLASTPLERLTTRQIAGELGISQPALFRHFRSRDALLVAVIDAARANLAGIAEQVLAKASAREQLGALMQNILAYVERHPGLPALLFSTALPADGPVRSALEHVLSMQSALVAELVREGQRTGELDATVAAEQAATAFIGLIQGTILQWRLGRLKAPLAEQATTLYRLWLDGAGAGDMGSSIAKPVMANPAVDQPAVDQPAVLAATAKPPVPAEQDPQLRELDVRPVIAGGDDPQQLISGHVAALPAGSVLKVVAPFRPLPLVALLRNRGHAVEVVEHGAKHFVVEIVIESAQSIEDLRDLEPPEPLERVLEVGTRLESGEVFLARLPRFPRLLLDHLKDRALRFSIYEEPDATVLLLLHRPAAVKGVS